MLVNFREAYSHLEFGANTEKEFDNKYGYIEILNPDYMKEVNRFGEKCYDERKYIFRKPTPQERREIVINFIIDKKEEPFNIKYLASKLAVSERTIQNLFKKLKEEKLIEVIARFDEYGRQKTNVYRYIGPLCEKYGTGLTLPMVYDKNNRAGFRDWDWNIFKFKQDGLWYDNSEPLKIKMMHRLKKQKYLAHKGITEEKSEVPLKCFRMYFHTETNEPKLCKSANIKKLDSFGNVKNDSKKKYVLMFDGKPIKFTILGVDFYFKILGDEFCPKVELYSSKKIKLSTFTLYGKNKVCLKAKDDNVFKKIKIIAEFSTK